MANEILIQDVDGSSLSQIRFAVVGSLSPAVSGTNLTIGSPTDVVLTLAGVGDDAGRQSDKVDLGAIRAETYSLLGCVDFTAETPVAGQTVDYYWAPSTSSVVGQGNIAGNSGVDGIAPSGALGSITLAEFEKQCVFIGSLVVHDGASVQNGTVGILRPPTRYGQLVVHNNAGGAFEADDVEMHQVLNPQIPEIQ